MNPWKVSAKFAAFVWFSGENPHKTEEEASRYAERNWLAFLPCAHKGIGRLLVKIAGGKMPRRPLKNVRHGLREAGRCAYSA